MDFRTAEDGWSYWWCVAAAYTAGGYDHNWVLNTEFGKVQKFAQVEDEKAGRIMEVYTDLPGVQFYAGNFIDPQTGKDGASYGNDVHCAWKRSIFQIALTFLRFCSQWLKRESLS